MIRKDLYESVHGALRGEPLKHVQQLETYFETRRESTSQITILPNFCKDNDMTDFMIASHNEYTVLKAVAKMQQMNIRPGSVCFAQLLGMSDHISYTLGSKNIPVFKYVPYGPINEVLPYLIRRAEENSDMLDSATREIAMMK